MSRPGDALDARMRGLFAAVDTSPEFAARLAARIASVVEEPAAAQRVRVERQREALQQRLRREAWTGATAAAGIGAAAIAAVWRHGPAVADKVEGLLTALMEPSLLGGLAIAVLASALWPVLQRYAPR
jgi:hypothetical protein